MTYLKVLHAMYILANELMLLLFTTLPLSSQLLLDRGNPATQRFTEVALSSVNPISVPVLCSDIQCGNV